MNVMTGHKAQATGTSAPIAAHRLGDTQTTRVGVYLCLATLDVIGLCCGYTLSEYFYQGVWTFPVSSRFYATLLPLFLGVSFYLRLYSFRTMMSVSSALGRLALVLSTTLSLNLLIVFLGESSAGVTRVVFFAGAALTFVILGTLRVGAVWMVVHVLQRRFMRRVLVLDGCHTDAPAGFEVIDAQRRAIVPDVYDPIMLHNFSSLIAGADRVVVSCQPEKRESWSMYLRGAGCSGELLVPELHVITPVHSETDTGWIGIRVSTGPLDLRSRLLKRAFDLAITVPAIILLSPLFALVAIAIKLDSPGGVLFRQRRMGRGNRLFDVLKFRSMTTAEADGDGKQSTRRDDKRVTRVGRIIRATSIDELPQLFNVLMGCMSLVGPRPHALGSKAGNQLFWNVDERYWLRHAIKPGITGLAQVRGYRGTTEREQDLTDRLQSDLEYVANWTLVRDLSILVRTAMVMVHQKAY